MILDSDVPELKRKLTSEEKNPLEIDAAVRVTLESELERYARDFLPKDKITTDYRLAIQKVVKEATERKNGLSQRGIQALDKLENSKVKWNY